MPQFGRPIADTVIGAYTDEAGGTANIFEGIDEVTPEDVEFVRSEVGPSSSVYACALTSSLEDPLASTGHIIRSRANKSAAGGAQIDLTVQLRQGYVNEGAQGTLIATLSQSDIDENFTTYAYTLSSGEADAITDYTDLAYRNLMNQV